MDEQTLEKNDVLQELLKSEYDLAKHECEYYTQEFNKQDTVYAFSVERSTSNAQHALEQYAAMDSVSNVRCI